MQITALQLTNFKAFESLGPLPLGDITLLMGANNAGKSTILQAIYAMQLGIAVEGSSVRVGADFAEIITWLHHPGGAPHFSVLEDSSSLRIRVERNGQSRYFLTPGSTHERETSQFPARDPMHAIVPYLSRRKVTSFSEDVRLDTAHEIGPNFSNLAGKLSRIGNRAFPLYSEYADACREILGQVVTSISSPNGALPGVYVSEDRTIPITAMGDGVPHIVSLLADLSLATGKVFLIEEIENDLHPSALKALLGLILKSAEKNQFVLSTHSNIVMRHLGTHPQVRIYHVTRDLDVVPPTAEIAEITASVSDRRAVLSELGYELYDFDLWAGWLILEESSAESIIKNVLIPKFVPGLIGRLGTLAAGGNERVKSTFTDFERLVLFTHLEPVYRDRAWVLIDGDERGVDIIQQLRETYGPTWQEQQFRTLSKHNFEEYYPERYGREVAATLAIADKREKRVAKRALLEDVLECANVNWPNLGAPAVGVGR
jgi:hypothetical protein